MLGGVEDAPGHMVLVRADGTQAMKDLPKRAPMFPDKTTHILQDEGSWTLRTQRSNNVIDDEPPALTIVNTLPFAHAGEWLARKPRDIQVVLRQSFGIAFGDVLEDHMFGAPFCRIWLPHTATRAHRAAALSVTFTGEDQGKVAQQTEVTEDKRQGFHTRTFGAHPNDVARNKIHAVHGSSYPPFGVCQGGAKHTPPRRPSPGVVAKHGCQLRPACGQRFTIRAWRRQARDYAVRSSRAASAGTCTQGSCSHSQAGPCKHSTCFVGHIPCSGPQGCWAWHAL